MGDSGGSVGVVESRGVVGGWTAEREGRCNNGEARWNEHEHGLAAWLWSPSVWPFHKQPTGSRRSLWRRLWLARFAPCSDRSPCMHARLSCYCLRLHGGIGVICMHAFACAAKALVQRSPQHDSTADTAAHGSQPASQPASLAGSDVVGGGAASSALEARWTLGKLWVGVSFPPPSCSSIRRRLAHPVRHRSACMHACSPSMYRTQCAEDGSTRVSPHGRPTPSGAQATAVR